MSNDRNYLSEALDIIAGRPSPPRLLLRMPERAHLLALEEKYQVLVDVARSGTDAARVEEQRLADLDRGANQYAAEENDQ